MTDKQLAILLRQHAQRLRAEIDKVAAKMPPEMTSEHKSLLGGTFQRVQCLEDLYEYVKEIEKTAALLESEKPSS